MGIFDITYSIQARRLTPPKKQDKPVLLSWVYSLLSPLQWISDLSIKDYRTGTTTPAYDSLSAYVAGVRVKWLDGSVYESLVDTNIGEAPVGSFSYKWYKVLNSFVGAEERVLFNGQKVVLEYALNRFLNTNFEQPDFDNPSVRSVIYIDNQDTDDNSFLVGETSPETSFVAASAALVEDYVGMSFTPNSSNFIVYYPSTFTTNQVQQLMSLTEKYKLYGTTPTYQLY